MTLLLATVAPGFALLSQDTAFGATGTASAELLVREAVTADGFAGDTMPSAPGGEVALIDHHRAKIQLIPGLRGAIGGAGCVATHFRWLERLVTAGVDSIEAIAAAAPELLAGAWSRGAAGPYMAVAVGWSDIEGQPLGFAFASGEGFAPRRIEPGSGHALHPGPATEDAAYDELAAMWGPAALGHGALPFHRAYGANVARAWSAGRYPRGMVVGGFLQTVTITEDGVTDAWAALPGEVPSVLHSPIGPLRVALGPDDTLQFPAGGLVMVDPEERDRLERALLERSQAALDAA
jgi:hypothetical protein